ncbi:MAG: hypothetical protein HZB29_13515 [Nitrospinae bacterium]|nr:hypothetical protein [Nitrospinota bacterium]
MKGEYGAFLKLMQEEKSLYGKILTSAEKVREELASGAGPEEPTSHTAERDALQAKVTQLDAKIAAELAKPGREGWLDKPEAAALRKEMIELVERIIETDTLGMKLVEGMFAGIARDFGAMASGRKTMAAYSGKGKKNTARLIDRAY